MIGGSSADGNEEDEMSIEERIRYLLQAAMRAEGEGESRIAQTLRRMADEARPVGPGLIGGAYASALGVVGE